MGHLHTHDLPLTPHPHHFFYRTSLGQTGTGHFSPAAAYHKPSDSALILDIARFKQPPYWAPAGVERRQHANHSLGLVSRHTRHVLTRSNIRRISDYVVAIGRRGSSIRLTGRVVTVVVIVFVVVVLVFVVVVVVVVVAFLVVVVVVVVVMVALARPRPKRRSRPRSRPSSSSSSSTSRSRSSSNYVGPIGSSNAGRSKQPQSLRTRRRVNTPPLGFKHEYDFKHGTPSCCDTDASQRGPVSTDILLQIHTFGTDPFSGIANRRRPSLL